MTNIEIDRRLALVIGYPADRVRYALGWGHIQVWNAWARQDGPKRYEGWQRFDHTDTAVIWRIAEQFDAWPVRNLGFSTVKLWGTRLDSGKEHNPATATALAVIQYVESKA